MLGWIKIRDAAAVAVTAAFIITQKNYAYKNK